MNFVGGMFKGCKSFTHLPDNFTIPDNVIDCSCMFDGCKSLTHLPTYFHIPNDANCTYIFDGCNKLKNRNPKMYKMVEI